jgi:hypothetical protein
MRLKRNQKIVIAVYILTLAYLFTYMPLVKSFPCGCKFMTRAWVWGDKPLIFDLHTNPNANGNIVPSSWSIEWWRLAPRLLAASIIALLMFVFVGGKKNGVAD